MILFGIRERPHFLLRFLLIQFSFIHDHFQFLSELVRIVRFFILLRKFQE
jgi:hypothetical protein